MAQGAVLSVTALSAGWMVDIKLEGLGTGGFYDLNLGPENDPANGSPTVIFTVVSQGYVNGVLTTRTRTLYGTVRVRKPFSFVGDELTAWETVSGSDVIVRIALNESIYDSDNNTGGTGGNSGVAPKVTILPGFYTQGGNPSLGVTNYTVTNNSTLAYPPVIGNWSRPIDYEKVGASIRVGASVFHGHAQGGRQVDCVKFTMADTSGNSNTVKVNAETFDGTYGHCVDSQGKPVAVLEHVADMPTSGLTKWNVLRHDFAAYPFIGNAESVLDTSRGSDSLSGCTKGNGTAAAPSPWHGPRFGICDKDGDYCQSFAVVDAANGNDGTGVVGVGILDPLNPPLAFATIGAAYTAVRSYNNTTYSRNNCGGSIFYLRDNAGGVNSFAWMGTTVTASTRPECVCTFTRFTGHSRDNVVIATQSGNRAAGELIKVNGIKLTAQSGSGIFDTGNTTSYVSFDQCEIDVPTTSPTFYRLGVWHMTRCLVKNFKQGWTNFGAVNCSPGINRGNTIDSSCTVLGSNNAFTILGTVKTSPLAFASGIGLTGSGLNAQNIVFAYNRITAGNTSGAIVSGATNINPHGCAYVQNVIENCNNSSPALQIAADASKTPANNILIFNNVIAGQRCSMAYNEYGATPYTRLNWFVKGNLADDYNAKADTFGGSSATATRLFSAGTVTVTVTNTAHQYVNGDLLYIVSATPAAYKTNGVAVSSVTANTFQYTFSAGSDPGAITAMSVAPNPLRVGNWPVLYGVNHSGNIWAETTGIGAAGIFLQDFSGIKCLPTSTSGQPPAASTNAATYLKFVDRKAFDGSVTGAGGGDYHLQSDSPAVGRARDWILPAGLDGVSRRSGGASGAYEFGSAGSLLLRRRRCR